MKRAGLEEKKKVNQPRALSVSLLNNEVTNPSRIYPFIDILKPLRWDEPQFVSGNH